MKSAKPKAHESIKMLSQNFVSSTNFIHVTSTYSTLLYSSN